MIDFSKKYIVLVRNVAPVFVALYLGATACSAGDQESSNLLDKAGVDLGNSGDPLYHVFREVFEMQRIMVRQVPPMNLVPNTPNWILDWYYKNWHDLLDVNYEFDVRESNSNGKCGQVDLQNNTIYLSIEHCPSHYSSGLCNISAHGGSLKDLKDCHHLTEFATAEVLHLMGQKIPQNQKIAHYIRKSYEKGGFLEDYHWNFAVDGSYKHAFWITWNQKQERYEFKVVQQSDTPYPIELKSAPALVQNWGALNFDSTYRVTYGRGAGKVVCDIPIRFSLYNETAERSFAFRAWKMQKPRSVPSGEPCPYDEINSQGWARVPSQFGTTHRYAAISYNEDGMSLSAYKAENRYKVIEPIIADSSYRLISSLRSGPGVNFCSAQASQEGKFDIDLLVTGTGANKTTATEDAVARCEAKVSKKCVYRGHVCANKP